jgi:hypothetical protein
MNFLPFEINQDFPRSTTDQQLTVEQRELLICLFEEAAEVTQTVAKILRFGYGSHNPFSGISNADLLLTETADFLAIVDRLVELGLLSSEQLTAAIDAKLAKLENYLLFKGDLQSIENT